MASLTSSSPSSEQTLRRACDRTGYAFACMFSTSEEFEADIIRERRAQGAYARPRRWMGWARTAALFAVLTFLFLMV